jgi:hypothetical protein
LIQPVDGIRGAAPQPIFVVEKTFEDSADGEAAVVAAGDATPAADRQAAESSANSGKCVNTDTDTNHK